MRRGFALAAPVLLGMALAATAPAAPVTVTLDATKRHQAWEGWEATIEHFHLDAPGLGDRHPIPQPIIDRLLDDAVDELGLTAVRLEALIMASRQRPGLEPENDNADPFVLDASRIRWDWFDPYVRCVAIPFKRRVEARGDPFVLNLHAVAWGAWHWREPASDPGQEYAEIMMGCLDRLRERFGLVPAYLTIYNEPDNGSEGPDVVIRAMRALAARMAAARCPTKLRYPDACRIRNAVVWIDRVIATAPELFPRIGEFSFHGYGGFDAATLHAIRSRAQARGIPTAQTEWWFTSNHPPDIMACMTEADAVLYEPYALGLWPSNDPKRGLYGVHYEGGSFPLHGYTDFARGPGWYAIYPFSASIRPGDVRIDATSSAGGILAAAFARPSGGMAVVLHNRGSSARDIEIRGAEPGTYEGILTDGAHRGEALPRQTVAAGGALSIRLAAGGTVAFRHAAGRTAFRRADANADARLDLADAVTVLNYLFGLAGAPSKEVVSACPDAADADDDGRVDIGDAIRILAHLFAGGEAPPEPFGACGPDPTADGLACTSFPPCS